MEEENLVKRIGDAYLNPNFVDGQVLLHTDMNEIVSVTKTAINENYNDIQRLQNGTLSAGNANTVDSASVSRFADGELPDDDNVLPTAQQVKSFINSVDIGQSYELLEQIKEEVVDARGGKISLDTRFDGVESDINIINTNIEKISTDVETNKTDIATNKSGIATNASAIERLNTELNNTNETVSEVSTALETTNANLDTINTNLGLRLDKKPYFFNSVDEMKKNNKLKNGDVVETIGYYSVNDGGEATYKIRTKTDNDTIDEGSIIEISSTLVAELVTNESVNVKQFGSKGDGVTNDTNSIQNAINYCQDNKLKLIFSNDTYLVTTLLINKFLIVDGLNATLKSINNNNSSEYILKLYYEGTINSIIENLNIDGNRTNNSNSINGLVIDMFNYYDTRLQIKNVKVNYCTNYGVYITGNWNNTSVREMTINGLVCYKNKIGLYANSISDSYIENACFDHNDEYGCYLDSGATIKISNTKAYFNGGKLNTDIDVNRLPESAFVVTTDSIPSSSKKYYTRTGTGSWEHPYEYTLFTGSSFVSGTTYYVVNGTYKNHGNGIYLKTCTGIYLSNCEVQDNAGDGIYVEGGNLLTIDNTGFDSNGLIFDDNNQVYSYESKNLVQYFYGIYIKDTIYSLIRGYANNFRYNEISNVQRSGIYAYNVQYFSFKLSSRLQLNNIDYKKINIKNFNGVINGKSIKIPIELSNISLNGNYEFNKNNWNGSNIYSCDGILYFKLIIDNNIDKIPISENTDIGTFSYMLRPELVYITTGVVSATYMDQEYGVGYISIDPNGHLRIKSDKENCRALCVSGSYIIKD